MKTLKTWKIVYWIDDGGHEYADYILHEAEEMTPATAAAAVATWWLDDGDPAEEEAFARALLEEGCAALPDGRLLTGLGWEAVSPIVVTVSGGVVQAVTGVPDGVTVEVQDWDGDERDEAGEAVPDIAVWEGPC